MQKFSIALIALLIAGGGYLLYSNKQLNNEISDLKANGGGDFPKGCNPCKNYANYPAFQRLDTALLGTMAREYKHQMNTTFTANNKGNADAEAIWFDLDTLKRFIWEIETNVCKNKCNKESPKPNLGIRIYYARYPVTGPSATFPQLTGIDPAYKNKHTLFMVPTYDASGNGSMNTDFDPLSFDAVKCKYIPLEALPKVAALGGFAAASSSGSSNATARNHGSLCPPVCPTGTTAFRN